MLELTPQWATQPRVAPKSERLRPLKFRLKGLRLKSSGEQFHRLEDSFRDPFSAVAH